MQKFFSIFFLQINRIATEFFFKYKKIAIIFFEFFFFEKIFFSFFLQIFFIEFFFGENFSFHKNISAKIFFTIFSRIYFVFDVCKIMYFAKKIIRNFAYCEFFFSKFGVRKKNCKFFLHFLFQRWTWIANLKMFLFWKKVKFSLIILLDFFTHY